MCWGTLGSCFPWIKTKADLKTKLHEDAEFANGKFREARQMRGQLLKEKAAKMLAEGKDLNQEKIDVRMTARDKDLFSEEKCRTSVSRGLVTEDTVKVKAMLLTEAAYRLHVGDPKKLKPQSSQSEHSV